MNKKLFLGLAAAVLVATPVVAIAEGENPTSPNQLIQKHYVSWRDAADEAERQVVAHDADIVAEAKATDAVVAAQRAIDAFVGSGYSGHDFEERKAKLQANYDEAYNNAYTTTRLKYRKNLEEVYIAAAKAQGNWHNESAVNANRPNEDRIKDDIEKNEGKKSEVTSSEATAKEDGQTEETTVKKDTTDSSKSDKKVANTPTGEKVLPKTSAVK